MAITDLPVTQLVNFDGNVSANKFKVTEQAADVANGNRFKLTSREILLCRNTNAASTARTVTITSQPDRNGRTKDITTYSVGAGEVHAIPPLQADGWKDAEGYLNVSGSHAEMLFSVIRLQGSVPL